MGTLLTSLGIYIRIHIHIHTLLNLPDGDFQNNNYKVRIYTKATKLLIIILAAIMLILYLSAIAKDMDISSYMDIDMDRDDF